MVAQTFTVDLNKPLVFQVGHLGEAYQEWVHRPIVSKEGPRFFASNFWEFLTRTVWWVIPLIWLPVVCWSVSVSIRMGCTFPEVVPLVLIGILVWTLMEYTLHRFLFHIKTKSYCLLLLAPGEILLIIFFMAAITSTLWMDCALFFLLLLQPFYWCLFAELTEANPSLAYLLFSQPTQFLPLFDEAAHLAQDTMFKGIKDRNSVILKEFVHVRINISGSPLEFPETFPSIGRVRVKHRGILLTLKGTVIKSGAIKMIEGEREYQCWKCKHM